MDSSLQSSSKFGSSTSLSSQSGRTRKLSDPRGGAHSEPEMTDGERVADSRLTQSTQMLSLVGSNGDNKPLGRRQRRGTDMAVGFTSVETPYVGGETFGDDITAKALEQCKKTVLKPYHIFLKTIGFRRFKPIVFDIDIPCHYRLINWVWPLVLCIFLIGSCVTQILLCFGRDKVHPDFDSATLPPNHTYCINCEKHLLTSYLIPDVLLLVAYVYSLYVFRMALPEHLTTLMETVFLGILSREGKYSHKQLTRSLQVVGLFGLLWTLFSLCVSILRVFAEKQASATTVIHWIPNFGQPARICLVVVSIIGFIGFDMAYTAVVLNYSIECQLMIYYLKNICQRILSKEWAIDEAIREINNARQFLSTMNRHLSRAVSIMLLLFLTMSVMSVVGLQQLNQYLPNLVLAAITGFLASLQWSFMFFLPIVQAARVSRAGKWLVRTSLEIRSRPYSYKDTPQLELDSFVTYSSTVDFSAKLVGIAITPALVILGTFMLAFVLFMVFQYDKFKWASWL